MKKKILFVCLGNICRSQAAQGIMEKMVEEQKIHHLVIDSAGTYGGHAGESADSRMAVAAAKRGYTLLHKARAVRPADFERFDLILAMDDNNYDTLRRMSPDVEGLAKIKLITSYCSQNDIDHVPDPYYGGAEGFERVLDILEDACGNLLKKIA